MADRYFPNIMPDFVAENPKNFEEEKQHEIIPQGTQDSLLKLLSLPYSTLSEQLERAALDLKETIVVETWGLSGQRVEDFTLYCGSLGTAFFLFKSFQVTHNKNDLSLCSEIVKACDTASHHSSWYCPDGVGFYFRAERFIEVKTGHLMEPLVINHALYLFWVPFGWKHPLGTRSTTIWKGWGPYAKK